jgi:xylulokinase
MADLFVGIDIGSTAVKAGLFDRTGLCIASWRRAYATERPAPGIVEQDPIHWLYGVRDGLAAVLAGIDEARVAGLGMVSQVNTDVFVDAKGHPVAPAIFWQDGRAATEAAELDAMIAPETKLVWWGAPMPIGASHVLAKMLWMARHRPDVFARTCHVLSPKDFCLFHMAGAAVADPIAAFGQVGPDLAYIGPLLDLVPGAADRLPRLRAMSDVVGEVELSPGGRRVPVVAGTMDAWGNLFGCGVSRPGDAMYMSGTSEILAIAADRRIPAPGVVGFPIAAGLAVSAGPTQSGGDSLRWLAGIIGGSPLDVPKCAETADRDKSAVLFLPQLEGERAPLWDSALRGAFIGLDSRSAAPEMALAVLEGVALSARMLFDALKEAASPPPRQLFYGGGGGQSDLWSQIRADCLGLPLHRVAHADAGTLGAAILAGVGAGCFHSLAEAASGMARYDRVFEPDPRRRRRYDALYDSYRAAISALRPLGRITLAP